MYLHLNDVRRVARYVQLTTAWFEEARPGNTRLLSVASPRRHLICTVIRSLLVDARSSGVTQVKAELDWPFRQWNFSLGSLFRAAILFAKNLFGQGEPCVE